MNRHDVFIKTAPGAGDHGTDHKLYVAATLPANAKRIASALTEGGDSVLILTHSRNGVGKFVAAYAPKPTKVIQPGSPEMTALLEAAARHGRNKS